MSEAMWPSPTPRYAKILDASAGLAREMGHSYLGVEHLFLAIMQDRDAVPTQALARIADIHEVEANLRDEMASPGYAGASPANAAWFPVSELHDLLRVIPRCIAPGVRYGFNIKGDQAYIHVQEPGDTAAAVAAARTLIEQERR
jgi:hypothetical protein